jgi:hypothetical protein
MRQQLVVLVGCLTMFATSRLSSAALLSVDFNERVGTPPAPSATQAGFSSFMMSGTTASSVLETQAIGAYTVTLQAFDDGQDENIVTAGVQNTVGVIDDRLRATPVNGGSLTYEVLYRDFIFAQTGNGPTGGMDLTVSGGALLANTQYLVSIYSFDSGSTPLPQPRTANWLDGNNSDALVLATSFSGAALPTTDNQYRFTGIAQTNGSGVLLLKGRNTTANIPTGTTGAGGVQIGVFINALEIDVVPEPTSIGMVMIAAVLVGLAPRRRQL